MKEAIGTFDANKDNRPEAGYIEGEGLGSTSVNHSYFLVKTLRMIFI
jgi:hypothetical protein